MDKFILADLQREIQTELPNNLCLHIFRVSQLGLYISQFWPEINKEYIWIACLAHDRFRHLEIESQKKMAKKWNLQLEDVPDYALHGYLAAEFLQQNYKVQKPEILKAVQNHTLLGPQPDLFSSIVFLADKLDFFKSSYSGRELICTYSADAHWKLVIQIAKTHENRFDVQHNILLRAINQLEKKIND